MASVGKVAAFAALLRVFVVGLPFYRDDWRPAIWVLAVLSLVVGSFLAVVQTDVKRMLAYSSISHAGFILVGVEAAAHRAGEADSGLGVPSVLVYLLAYAVMVAGTFGVVTLVARRGDGDTDLDAFRGLGQPRPVLALALTVLLVAQAGVPFTSGFIAKFGVIDAARRRAQLRRSRSSPCSPSVVAAFLYLRIMVSTWMDDPPDGRRDGDERCDPVPSGLAIAARRRVHARRRHLPRLAARRRRDDHPVRPLTAIRPGLVPSECFVSGALVRGRGSAAATPVASAACPRP